MVQAIPSDDAGVTPYLVVRDAARALDFHARGFGAVEMDRRMRAWAAGNEAGGA